MHAAPRLPRARTSPRARIEPGKIVFTGINYTTAKIEQALADRTATKDPDGTYRFEYTVAEQTTPLPEGVTGSVFTSRSWSW